MKSSSRYLHDDVIKWKHFPHYWSLVRGIHRSLVNPPQKGEWRGALIFSLIYAWTNGWVSNRNAGNLRRHRVHHDVTVMIYGYTVDPIDPWKSFLVFTANPSGELLLMQIKLNPSEDEQSHAQKSVAWNYLSIFKLQLHCLKLGMEIFSFHTLWLIHAGMKVKPR